MRLLHGFDDRVIFVFKKKHRISICKQPQRNEIFFNNENGEYVFTLEKLKEYFKQGYDWLDCSEAKKEGGSYLIKSLIKTIEHAKEFNDEWEKKEAEKYRARIQDMLVYNEGLE